MSVAERKAAAILHRADALKFSNRSALFVETAAPNMWDVFVKAAMDEVAKFAGLVPSAQSLIAHQPIPNNLTIETTLNPVKKVVLVKTEVGIQSTLTAPLGRYLSSPPKRNLPPLFFVTDEALKPRYSDGDRLLDLESAVDFMLEPIFDLFD